MINPIIAKIIQWKILIIISLATISSVATWAGLTKAGYIPNFLDLEILCSGELNSPINDVDNYKLIQTTSL